MNDIAFTVNKPTALHRRNSTDREKMGSVASGNAERKTAFLGATMQRANKIVPPGSCRTRSAFDLS